MAALKLGLDPREATRQAHLPGGNPFDELAGKTLAATAHTPVKGMDPAVARTVKWDDSSKAAPAAAASAEAAPAEAAPASSAGSDDDDADGHIHVDRGITLGDPTTTPVGQMSTKRLYKQDERGRLALEPKYMTIEPTVPIDFLPRRHWPPSYHVLTERHMVALNSKGTSEVIEHAEYANEVDSFNILARIPFIGLRIPLKCFLAWYSLSKRRKFARHMAALHVGALHLRPRAIRVMTRVGEIVDRAERRALEGEVTLLPSAHVDNEAISGAGPPAPTSLEFDAVVDAHCDRLRAFMRSILSEVAMAVDEEWLPLNWKQEMPPVEESHESQERRKQQQEMEAAIERFRLQQERAKHLREVQREQWQHKQAPSPSPPSGPQPPPQRPGSSGSVQPQQPRPGSSSVYAGGARPGSGTRRPSTAGSSVRGGAASTAGSGATGGTPLLALPSAPAEDPSLQFWREHAKQHGAERPRTASLMPPPPRGGFPISNVDWKPGRLSGARIQRSAVRGLPFQQVAQIQTAFSFASLSTPADTDKEKAKKTLEGAVTDKIRDLRARTERKELAKLLKLCDERLSECGGRLIEIAMRALMAQLGACASLPLADAETEAGRSAHRRRSFLAVATALEPAAAPPPLREGEEVLHTPRSQRADATTSFPIRLMPVRTELLVGSATQRDPKLMLTPELITTLYARAVGRAVVALQPAERLGHLRPMQRLLERTMGNYFPATPPPAPARPALPLERVHELRGNWRPHVKWVQMKAELEGAARHSFAVANSFGARELSRRAHILDALLTPEQKRECEAEEARRERERLLAHRARAAGTASPRQATLVLDDEEALAHVPEELREKLAQRQREEREEREALRVERTSASADLQDLDLGGLSRTRGSDVRERITANAALGSLDQQLGDVTDEEEELVRTRARRASTRRRQPSHRRRSSPRHTSRGQARERERMSLATTLATRWRPGSTGLRARCASRGARCSAGLARSSPRHPTGSTSRAPTRRRSGRAPACCRSAPTRSSRRASHT